MSGLAFAARHSMDSDSWYTPSPFVEAAREVMGGIDLDPASHEEANLTVKAARFFTKDDDGLVQDWRGRIFLNPPGGDGLVQRFWRVLMCEFFQQRVEQAVWIGYSLEQLQTLQNAGSDTPLNFPICVPKQRISFIENEAKRVARLAKLDAENADRLAKGLKVKRRSEKADAPSHANYITYLGSNRDEFARVFKAFGQVVMRGRA